MEFSITLISHFLKIIQIRRFLLSLFSRIWTEYGKIWTRKNSAFGLLSCSEFYMQVTLLNDIWKYGSIGFPSIAKIEFYNTLKLFHFGGANIHNLQKFWILRVIEFRDFVPNLHFMGIKVCNDKKYQLFNKILMTIFHY